MPKCICNPFTAMVFLAMFTFQLDNTKRQTLPAPHCRNGSCRYVRAMWLKKKLVKGHVEDLYNLYLVTILNSLFRTTRTLFIWRARDENMFLSLHIWLYWPYGRQQNALISGNVLELYWERSELDSYQDLSFLSAFS